MVGYIFKENVRSKEGGGDIARCARLDEKGYDWMGGD
jgi:hypothetical protein